MGFVHLHVHSEHSLLDGLAKCEALARRAADLDMPALALTDHGVMTGAVEFLQACQAHRIKPIIGMEAYILPWGSSAEIRAGKRPALHHITLLAANPQGGKNLMRLASLAQLRGFYYLPRIDHKWLAECAEGLICLTGCEKGEIPALILAGRVDEARARLLHLRDLFRDRLFVELQRHALPTDLQLVPALVALAKELSLPIVATNDVHYLYREDARTHDMLLRLKTNSDAAETRAKVGLPNDTFYLRPAEEMRALFADLPEAFDNTLAIAERCEPAIQLTRTFYLPHFRPPHDFDNNHAYFQYLCEVGFEARYGIPARDDGTWVHRLRPPTPEDGVVLSSQAAAFPFFLHVGAPDPPLETHPDLPIAISRMSPLISPQADNHPSITPRQLRERLRFEIDTITRLNFVDYMLIVSDIVHWCKRVGIPWNTRGSAAGSMVSYVLGLTHIEPVTNDLYFERFLNPSRVSMPDVDIDFPDDQRARVVEYVLDKYGDDHVAQIIALGTWGARSAVRDVARLLGWDEPSIQALVSLIPNIPGKPILLREAVESIPELQARCQDPKVKAIIEWAQKIEGNVRHHSTHAAGIVIADRPLIDCVPLRHPTGEPLSPRIKAITQYEMTHLESIGLLKMDLLGLSTLTLMRKACELINQRHALSLTPHTLPVHDPCIYDLLARGDVIGVFQVEGAGMRRLMQTLKPRRFEHVVAALALFRPGPMEYIPTYIRRMHGEEPVAYRHPDLEPALRETYGIIVYQEQIMRVARDIAGYSMGEADLIRKAIGKKQADELEKHRHRFINGAVSRGYSPELAEQIWRDIEFFARYGFNKSHAASYAAITCQTAWLKACYPLEFYVALLDVEIGNLEKIGRIIEDARKHGIVVLPPSVNYSAQNFAIARLGEQEAICYALGAIKHVGEPLAQAIVQARSNQPYVSIDDLIGRLPARFVNRRALEALIHAGACDDFGNRDVLLQQLDRALAHNRRFSAAQGTLALLGTDTITSHAERQPLSSYQIQIESQYLGCALSIDPWQTLKQAHQQYPRVPTLTQALERASAKFAHTSVGQQPFLALGIVTALSEKTDRYGRSMAYAIVEDEQQAVQCVLFHRIWAQWRERLHIGRPVILTGILTKRHDEEQEGDNEGLVRNWQVTVDRLQCLDVHTIHTAALKPSTMFSEQGTSVVSSSSVLQHDPSAAEPSRHEADAYESPSAPLSTPPSRRDNAMQTESPIETSTETRQTMQRRTESLIETSTETRQRLSPSDRQLSLW